MGSGATRRALVNGWRLALPDGSRLPVFHGLTGVVRRRDKIALTGVNGAGKSTLLKMIAGALAPDDGAAVIGASVQMGYYAQHVMEQLGGDRTVLEELQEHAPNANQGTLRSLAGAFGFHDDDVFKPITVLSGGERARVALAKLLYDAPNLLVLDEPTNHLDLPAIEQLESALANYEGTLLLVTHDRALLDDVTLTRRIELVDGRIVSDQPAA